MFHISLFNFQSLEWKIEGTKSQTGLIPSLSHRAAVQESRIWVIQVHLFFPFFLKGFDPHLLHSFLKSLRNLPRGFLGMTHLSKPAGPQERPRGYTMVNRLMRAGDVSSEAFRHNCKPYLAASHFLSMPFRLCNCVRALGYCYKFQECPNAHTASSPWLHGSFKDCNLMNGISDFILIF